MTERYQVGQEVRVTLTARVAEVPGPTTRRARRVIRLEAPVISSGWAHLDDEEVKIELINGTLPTDPGVYWGEAGAEAQAHMGNFHTDGREFYYRNTSSEWVDIGWGEPSPSQTLNPLTDRPF
jgi:hypothetical protein